jgi:hypothetical protein
MAAPVLFFPEKTAPLAVLAAASLAGVDLEVKADAKAAKDSQPVLTFPSGCAPKRHGQDSAPLPAVQGLCGA